MIRYILSEDANYIIKIEGVLRSVIPCDQNNRDYKIYLTWLAEGNTPEAAEGGN